MDTISDNSIITAAAASIRRAKPKTFYVIDDRGFTDVLSAAEFKKLRPHPPVVEDVVDVSDKITPKLLAKLQDALDNTPYLTDGVDTYARVNVEKAKEVTGIQFRYDYHWDSYLLSNGLLVIGCQRHKLSVWESATPDSSWNGTVLQNHLANGVNAAARDALIPVLKEKLKTLRAKGGAK